MNNDNAPSRPAVSAAGLKVPPPPPLPSNDQKPPVASPLESEKPKWSQAQQDALLHDLYELHASCRCNKQGEAYALITECIFRGVDTAGHIISTLAPFGLGRGQIGSMLNKGKRPYWQKDRNGRYTLTAHHPLMAEAGDVGANKPAT